VILINGTTPYYSRATHDVLVCAINCSGDIETQMLKLWEVRFGISIRNHYKTLCENSRVSVGKVEYWWRGLRQVPTYMLFWPLSPNIQTPYSAKAWVDCVEETAEAITRFNWRDVGIPLMPELRGKGFDSQTSVLMDLLEGAGRECDITIYDPFGFGEVDEIEGQEEDDA
jgi:hypothetical protein